MGRDNIAGTKGGILKTLFLLPGMIIQWFMYVSVGGVKGYGKVREQTRLARSPLMTWVYSIGAWGLGGLYILGSLLQQAPS
jgi:hypothetical protein